MISEKDVKKLADLARIEVGESELEGLASDMGVILDYVGQIKDFSDVGDVSVEDFVKGELHNVMREDINPTEPGMFSKEIIAEFPNSEDGYLKVNKIL